MESQLIVLIVFLGLSTGIVAVGMFACDLVASFSGGRSAGTHLRPVRLRRVARPDRDAAPAGVSGRFDQWFSRLVEETGWGWTPVTGALLVWLGALLAGGSVFLWTDQPMAASVGGLFGAVLVIVVLSVQRVRHISRLQQQFPTALEFIARSVRAGHNLDEAIVLAGSEGPQPLATEFAYCARQLELGLGVPAAVRSLADRLRLADVRVFATLLGVHRESGGNIAEVLERLALSIRDRMSYHRQLRAITSAGRMSAFFVAALGPILFVYMLVFHPEYGRALIETPLGQTLLMGAAVLEVIGLAWTARLLKPMY